MAIAAEKLFLYDPRVHDERDCEPSRILIADADPALRRTLPRLLSQGGRSFDACGTLAEALTRLGAQHYDVVLVDQRLPDGTGLDVLDWLVRRKREEVVILTAADDATDAAVAGLRRGAHDFVRKPYHIAQLQRTLGNALHKTSLERTNRAMGRCLHASERLHRYLVENSPNLIFTLDAEGRFSYANPGFEQLLGIDRHRLLERRFLSLVVHEDQERMRQLLAASDNPLAPFTIELRLRRRDGDSDHVTVALKGIPVARPGDVRGTGLYGIAHDISERKRAEEIIAFQSYHDHLTRLPNRALFKDRLELAIAQAQRRRPAGLAVMFIDIDRFKLINDSFGHAGGDELLRAIATRLARELRRGDTLARLGGDEFAVLLPELAQPEVAETIARKVLAALAQPFEVAGGECRVTASIGVAVFPRDGGTEEALTQHAEIAMYQVKRSGKNGFRFFNPELNSQHHSRIALENDLRRALDRSEFELYYQPQVSVSQRRVVGMEALLRWNHPRDGLVGPNVFIPIAEETGLIGEISRWVLDAACGQLARWRRAGFADLNMSLNLSTHDFERGDIVAAVNGCLRRHRIPPARLDLEITESMMMQDAERVARRVRELRSGGVGIAIDDFGTGYSALAYLQKFPISTLKIDRSFVRELDGATTNPIVSAIAGIARGFGLQLIAEGVERAEQAETLRALGCDVMQGYYYSRPASAAEATAWMSRPPEALLN